MASVLWLDFDTAALARSLTSQFLASFSEAANVDRPPDEEAVIAAADGCGLTDAQIADFATQHAVPAEGLLELWHWAHWNRWHMAVGGVTFDLLMNPVLDAVGIDRAARHAGRTDTHYRRRVRFLSPRGVEIRSSFVAAYLGAHARAGDLVVYVGGNASDAALCHAAFIGDTAGSVPTKPLNVRTRNSLPDVTRQLEAESPKWQESFSSTTTAEG